MLGDVRAVKNEGVVPALPLDGVAPVARVPDHCVISFTQQDNIVASTSTHYVIARSTDNGVAAVAGCDRVIALAPIQYQRYVEPSEAVRGGDRVRSALSDHRERQGPHHIHPRRKTRNNHPGITTHR